MLARITKKRFKIFAALTLTALITFSTTIQSNATSEATQNETLAPAAPALTFAGITATPTPNPLRAPEASQSSVATQVAKMFLPLLIKTYQVAATATPTTNPTVTPNNNEWSQHAHDAQHTSYTDAVVPTPWRWKWAWNGPDANGAISAGKTGLPRNSQPVTGNGKVYIAAGSRGVFALNNANGAVVWNSNPGGSINSTPAYDAPTGSLFVLSSNGTLYKMNAQTGSTTATFATGATSTLPLPPAVINDRVLIAMGNKVFAINKTTMAQIWAYDAGSPAQTPPAYSPSRNRVIAVSQDLYVHAINNVNGAQAWRVKPTVRTGGDPGSANTNLAQVLNGWPVIAETHGYVLVKLRLDWQALWGIWSPWPSDNVAMRSLLQANPAYQALMALNLDDGSTPFIANVAHGGFGDGGYLPMGPQPVVKRFANGQEVAYVVMRGAPCLLNPCDGRWDSHLGEMLLDNTTVAGYQAGYVRFIRNTFFPSDEQANISMSGDMIFGGHWAFGLAHQITDRSASKGTGTSPISTTDLPHISGADNHNAFSPSHYNSDYLCAENCARQYPPGFYIYYSNASVWDQYWTEYASWMVSGNTIYFVSTDGALVALENGNPLAGTTENPVMANSRANIANSSAINLTSTDGTNVIPAGETIPYIQARQYAGQTKTVEGTIRFLFNNYQAVYLGFKYPHQGEFKIRILKKDWNHFPAPPETLYRLDQRVRVTGLIQWYQGDPVIYVTDPSQIQVIGP